MSIAYIADKSVKVKEVKDLNFILKKALSEKIDSDAQKRVITINKDDLSITDNLHELVFYYNDEALVITKDCSFLTIAQEEENDKIVYKISSYQEWFDEE